eukprot:gene142-151_t
MSVGSSNVAHEYDPKLVFRNYNSNAPILQSWIEDLIRMTTDSLPANQIPTTETLVQAFQRYDVVFKELLRQNMLFSEHLTKLFANVWAGVLNLMTYMIKSYHRYVKHTSHLQSQAQELLTERQRGEAAKKVQREEFELERTALRAGIRNLEAELESSNLAKKIMEHENDKLRRVISTYIQSSDFSSSVWDLMKEDDPFASSSSNKSTSDMIQQSFKGRKALEKIEQQSQSSQSPVFTGGDDNRRELGFRRKDVVDCGKQNLRILNRMDVEINEILSNVLKEKNRQRLLMKDLMRLVTKNKEMFSIALEQDEQHIQPRRRTSAQFQALQKTAAEMEGVDMSIQVDFKDEYGLTLERLEDLQTVDTLTLGVAPLAPTNIPKIGTDIPYLIRRCMSSFPRVLRIPPAMWTFQMILSIYFDKMQDDEERDKKGLKRLAMTDFVYQYFLKTMGLRSIADAQVSLLLRACEAHARKQPRISIFASQIGLINKEDTPPMDIRDTDFILQVLRHLLDLGELQAEALKVTKNKVSATSTIYIRPDISRAAALTTVQRVFDKWLPDGGEDCIIKVRSAQHSELGQRYIDVDQFVEMLIDPWNNVRCNWEEHARYLFRAHSTVYRVLQEATFANDEGRLATDTILVEIQKQSAQDCIRRPIRLFQKTDVVTNENNNRDGEAAPSNSNNNNNNNNNTNHKTNSNNGGGNPNKEAVAEAMGRNKFIDVLRIINPTMPIQEIQSIFEEALDMAHADALRTLELIWARYVDEASNYFIPTTIPTGSSAAASIASGGSTTLFQEAQNMMMARSAAHKTLGTNREFWVNLHTSISQWTRPYAPRIFRSQDIEIETFVQILIRKDIFAKSPFLELLNIAPRDLWPNADMFYKQIKEKMKKENASISSMTSNRAGGLLANNDGSNSFPTVAISLPKGKR